ncbi:MAG TPA: mandelate racemase/muconate lactonizing enzyme family protein [Pirellulales bacterium]|jgi:L-alanine-DL-glutamate epimerase-like enolase superfamily enzyme|nr:mandelate racemase/muconate lactonizing enzyme family protein [Pirellulales bacterium]
MKLTDVRTIALRGATHDHGWPGGTDPNVQYNTLVEVLTDEGLSGIGSCYTTRALVEGALELLRPHLIGEMALEPERVSEKLRQSMFWLGRGGSVEHAISGIDIALWDLFGKALGQPVSRLLGGNYRDRIKPYASILFEEPGLLRQKLLEQRERGFRAIKMGWRPFGRVSRKYDELLIRTARETVGDEVELMVDAGGSEQFWPHGVGWARETVRMLGDYGVTWFEEALKPDDVEGFRELRCNSPVLIATGEVLTRRQSFQPFITSRALDIIQPDLTKCGGLSEGRRLGWMAYDHGVLLVPHGWNTGVGVAADLALTAALPVARWVEYQTGVPYIEELISPRFSLDADGMLRVPSGPGLGIELNADSVERLSR